MTDTKKGILKALNHFAYLRDKKQVFMDAVEFNALMLSAKTDDYRLNERLLRAQDIYADYHKNNQDFKNFKAVSDGIYNLLSGMTDHFGDHLGEIYMEIAGNSKAAGQYFTPYHVSKMMAMITLGEKPAEEKVFTLNEPCCGSGGMVVAAADVWTEQGYNYANNALVVANDVDRNCVLMSYLQISFTGMPAIIKHQDTLTQKTWDRFITPAFALQYPKFKRVYDGLSDQYEM